mmetsp:Transcript_37132/g.114679  ORF Transcript_37132/g.114679 Transcript_37132/m.114679 type:complete len:214 (-) Transcript_37132:76-717(-)
MRLRGGVRPRGGRDRRCHATHVVDGAGLPSTVGVAATGVVRFGGAVHDAVVVGDNKQRAPFRVDAAGKRRVRREACGDDGSVGEAAGDVILRRRAVMVVQRRRQRRARLRFVVRRRQRQRGHATARGRRGHHTRRGWNASLLVTRGRSVVVAVLLRDGVVSPEAAARAGAERIVVRFERSHVAVSLMCVVVGWSNVVVEERVVACVVGGARVT